MGGAARLSLHRDCALSPTLARRHAAVPLVSNFFSQLQVPGVVHGDAIVLDSLLACSRSPFRVIREATCVAAAWCMRRRNTGATVVMDRITVAMPHCLRGWTSRAPQKVVIEADPRTARGLLRGVR